MASEADKAQWVRVVDVIAIAPLCVWGGLEIAKRKPFPGYALAVVGVLTAWYNGRNWLINRRHRG